MGNLYLADCRGNRAVGGKGRHGGAWPIGKGEAGNILD